MPVIHISVKIMRFIYGHRQQEDRHTWAPCSQ